jgi:hypothetical protein
VANLLRSWRIVVLALVVLSLAAPLHAQTSTFKTVCGWGNSIRRGRWTPVYITVASSVSKTILLQIHGTYGTSAALSIQQEVVADRQPVTYLLFYPINGDPSHVATSAVDQATGRTLAWQLLEDPQGFSPVGHVPPAQLAASDTFIGLSGTIADDILLQAQLKQANLDSGIISMRNLPDDAVGYDSIKILLLASPHLGDLTSRQEQAILQWVNAGGKLVIIPGADSMKDSPLEQILPADIGDARKVPLPTTFPASRPSELNARELTALPGSEPLDFSNGSAEWFGFTRHVALGRVTVLPADISKLEFADIPNAIAFWKNALAQMAQVSLPRPITSETVPEAIEDLPVGGISRGDEVGRGPRETLAIRHWMQQVEQNSPAGSSNRTNLILLLAGICLILGPFDSIGLLRLGRSPWHVLTVIGWAGLAACAVSYGISFIHFGSNLPRISKFTLIDQIGDGEIIADDLLSISSERDTVYSTNLDKKEWWEPANQTAGNYASNIFPDFVMQQDRDGCRPETVQLHAGQPLAFHGERMLEHSPIFQADLTIHRDEKGIASLVGKITNNSDQPISDIQITSLSGTIRVDETMSPGSAVSVSSELSDQPTAFSDLPIDILDISPDMTDAMQSLVKSGHWACIYGRMPSTGDANSKQIIRELVQIN